MTFTMDEGEYLRIQADYTGSEAPWDDLAGATVTMTAAVDLESSPTFTTAGTLDAASSDGKVHSFGAVVPETTPAGYYVGTLTVTKAGDGYPQHEPFYLVVNAVV